MAPQQQQHWSTSLLGPKILTKPKTTGVPTASALSGKNIVALYFSASWYVMAVHVLLSFPCRAHLELELSHG
jgi:hypothetical protein